MLYLSIRCQFHACLRAEDGHHLKDQMIKPCAQGLMICSGLRASRAAMVGRGGLEPPTSRLSGVRSNHLSYRPGLARGAQLQAASLGGAYRDRTDDPLLAKQMLSQLS